MKQETTTVYVYKETADKVKRLKKLPEFKGMTLVGIYYSVIETGLKALANTKTK